MRSNPPFDTLHCSKTHHGYVMDESKAGLVGSNVGELLQRGELYARRASRVATRIQEVARNQR